MRLVEAIAARLTSVADDLRAASQCLAGGDAVPDRLAAGAEER